MRMVDLSVIIVNYNVEYYLEQCLHSVRRAAEEVSTEVWVVDNNSVDGSVAMVREKFPEAKLIANKENIGFSKANNQAIRQATGRYILLLNPDTLVEEDTFARCVAFMDAQPDAGGLGVKMIDGHGRFLPESKRGLPTPAVAFCKIFGLSALFPRSRTFGRYHLGYLSSEETHRVDVLSGAFMLMRREALNKTGLLDEAFFMYGEDIDLSYRITQAGYHNYYFPETRIIHYKGESTKKSSVNYVFVFYQAMVIFARKHFTARRARIFAFFIYGAIYFRASIALLSRGVKTLALPAADAAFVFALLQAVKHWYEGYSGISYHLTWMHVALGAYTAIWMVGVLLAGGYDRPFQLKKIYTGIATGTLAILTLYALLPESMRFSRAIILLGTGSTALAFTTMRVLLHLGPWKGLKLGRQAPGRTGIVAGQEEYRRISSFLADSGMDHSRMLHISPESEDAGPHAAALRETIEVYDLNTIIFSGQNVPSHQIISCMAQVEKSNVDLRIAPPESMYIIGSNSIHKGGELFMMELNAVNKPRNRRLKWLLDKLVATLLLLLWPLAVWAVRRKGGLAPNMADVLLGRKTLVGYAPTHDGQTGLPKIKSGVLYPTDGQPISQHPEDTARKLNIVYARGYSIRNDLAILAAGYRELGRRP